MTGNLKLAFACTSLLLVSACANQYDTTGYRYYPSVSRNAPAFSDSRIVVDRYGNTTRVGVPGEILFAYNSAVLYPDAANLIGSIATDLNRNYPGMEINVNGYADAAGARDYNRVLSQDRAVAVADELVRRGVDPSRIRTQGFGEANPRVPTPNGVREPLNRRVEIVLQPAQG